MIYYRRFPEYEDYICRQGDKARSRSEVLIAGIPRQTKGFVKRFKPLLKYFKPGSALCLGARNGAEVAALRKLGFTNSLGVDLWPLSDLVVKGDWHQLPFQDQQFQNAYTNCLDHCYDLGKFVAEVCRVTVPGARAVIENHTLYAFEARGVTAAEILNNGRVPSNTMFWDSFDDIMAEFIKDGRFIAVSTYHDAKWSGLVLERK